LILNQNRWVQDVTMIQYDQISFVVQGPFEADRTPLTIKSIQKVFPGSPIIFSTWEGTKIPEDIAAAVELVFNQDPGSHSRSEDPKSKPNNVNRQIVSSHAGLQAVQTDYAVKIRTDFLVLNNNFLQVFGTYQAFNEEYRVFEERVVVPMFGTRLPYGKHYNLPYHVSDFTVFGRTTDLRKLYDIPLVTEEEFTYMLHHTELKRETYSINRYNAEQSILLGCLRKQGKDIRFEYSTQIDAEIEAESYQYLINNFIPLSFTKYGIVPQKEHLFPVNNLLKYTDYITEMEWVRLYEAYTSDRVEGKSKDRERKLLNTYFSLEELTKKCEHRVKGRAGFFFRPVVFLFTWFTQQMKTYTAAKF